MGNILFVAANRKKKYYYDINHNSIFEKLLSHSNKNNDIYESCTSYKSYTSYKIFERYEKKKFKKKLKKIKRNKKKFRLKRINSNNFSDSEFESESTSDIEISYLDYYDLTKK